jgi:hypothetical protein
VAGLPPWIEERQPAMRHERQMETPEGMPAETRKLEPELAQPRIEVLRRQVVVYYRLTLIEKDPIFRTFRKGSDVLSHRSQIEVKRLFLANIRGRDLVACGV